MLSAASLVATLEAISHYASAEYPFLSNPRVSHSSKHVTVTVASDPVSQLTTR